MLKCLSDCAHFQQQYITLIHKYTYINVFTYVLNASKLAKLKQTKQKKKSIAVKLS